MAWKIFTNLPNTFARVYDGAMQFFEHHWSPALSSAIVPEPLKAHLATLMETLPLFHHLQTADTFYPNIAYDDVVLLGTGGSSLGAQTLCALRKSTSPRMHFLDNVDPQTFNQLWTGLDPAKTFFLIVSKSGNTVETLLQLLSCREQLGKAFNPAQFLAVTKEEPNALRTLAQTWGIPCRDHPPIGGRYSCFSVVGLLPAHITGLQINQIRGGALAYLKDPAPLMAAQHLYQLLQRGFTQSVMMPYCDRLQPFSRWYAQLWAESLGKKGFGMTPIPALGTVDQHSQLQLYLDGPQDKVFTLITLASQEASPTIAVDMSNFPAPLPLFQHKMLGDLMAAEQRATIETLKNKGCPVREIRLARLDEETLGALLMHFMLETMAMAWFLGVDPFDQPAVETGKLLAQKYLKNA